MLTTNKAVYGTDGSLTELGKLKGGSTPTPTPSIIDIHTDSDITGIDLYIGSDNDFTIENLPYAKYLNITVWLFPDDGGLIIGHVSYFKRDKTTTPDIAYDTNGEHLNLLTTAHDDDFDLHLSGDATHTIIYYEIMILKKEGD